MTRFQRMITEDMVPSVGVLHRTIETESAAIRARMGTVNAGLRRVELNDGTHLQIAWATRQFDSAKEFRQAVDDLHRHAGAAQGAAEEALAQFGRIRTLMGRFTGEDADSARWRDTVLDVRLSYTFYGREEQADGTLNTYRNTAAGSGGEQEKARRLLPRRRAQLQPGRRRDRRRTPVRAPHAGRGVQQVGRDVRQPGPRRL